MTAKGIRRVTTLDTSPLAPSARPETPDQVRERLDGFARRSRLRTPPEITEQRAVPRSTIAEMNAMDVDTIRDRFLHSRRDDRGPVTRFLDMLDLPRSLVANALFPGAAREAALRHETGAFGLPRVMFSDALKQMGVENRIVRGVVGFVGDVALDPLTYLGPAGFGLKVATGAGRTAEIGLRGRRELLGAINAVRKTGRLGEMAEETSGLLREFGITNERLARRAARGHTPEQLADYVSRRTLGSVKPTGGMAGEMLARVGGTTEFTAGGAFKRFGQVLSPEAAATRTGGRRASQIAAVDRFVRKFGKGRNPALRIGRDAAGKIRVGFNPDLEASSTIAHIPFTEIGLLNVPAFTPAARAAQLTQTIATAEKVGVRPFQTAETARVNTLGSQIEALTGEQVRTAEERADFARRHRETLADWESGDPVRVARAAAATRTPGLTPIAADTQVRLERGLADYDLRLQNSQAEIQAKLNEMRQVAAGVADAAIENPNEGNIGSLLATRQMVREASAKAGWLAAKQAELGPIRSRAEELRKIEDDVGRAMSAEERLAELQAVEGRGGRLTIGRRFLLADEATGEVLTPVNSTVRAAVARRIEPILDEIQETTAEIRLASSESRPGLFIGRADATAEDAAQFSADSLQGLRDRLDDLLDDLEDATAPLREPPRAGLQTLDEAREAIREQRKALLNDSMREVLELTPEEADARMRLADALNVRMEANFRLAQAAKASVNSLMDGSERHVRDVLKVLLDIDDDVIGASLLSSIRVLATDAFGLRDDNAAMAVAAALDGGLRKVFGRRSGYAHEMARVIRNTLSEGYRQEFIRVANQVRGEVRQTLKAANRSDEWIGDNIERAEALIMALAIKMRNGEAAEAGKSLVYPIFKVAPAGGGPPELSAFARTLKQAEDDGWFADPKLIDGLRRIARENVGIIDHLGEIEIEDQVLRSLMRGNIPNVPTIETTRLISLANQRARRAEVNLPREVMEQFQKARTTDRFRFIDSAGQEVEFLEMERGIAALPDQVVAQMPEEAQRRINDLRRIIAEFDALPEKPPAIATDPFEFNDMAQRGVFSLISGRSGDFMDTSIATAMASRTAAHQRAVARRNWTQYVQNFGLAINRDDLRRVVNEPGGTLRLADGRTARIGSGGTVIIGGERWRLLHDRDLIHNPIMQMMGDGNLTDFVYHEAVADQIESTARLFSEDESVRAVVGALESLTRAWKSVTLLHPMWTIMNVVGDGINAMAGGARPADIARHATNAVKMVLFQNDPEKLRQLSFTVRGQTMNGEELLAALRRHRVTETNIYAETAFQAVARGMMVLPSMVADPSRNLARTLRDPRRALEIARGDVLDAARQYALARNADSANAIDQLRGVRAVAGDRALRTVFAPWFRVNQKVSDALRAVTFLSHLEQGSDLTTAARRTIRSLFDYTDLTSAEAKARLLWPFLSWMRNNMAYQMKLLFERPIYVGSAPLVQNAIEEAIAGDAQVPLNMRPNWMREAVAAQVGTDPDSRVALLLSSATPMQEALTLGTSVMGVDGLQDFLHYFVSGLNPVLRAPVEIAVGRDFFSGREIGANQFEGDITVGQHLANQVRQIREAQAVMKAAREGGAGAATLRAIAGGRVQGFGEDRIRAHLLRQFQDEERRIRIAKNRATRDGNQERAVVAQVHLLQLYQRMMEAGLADEVPRAARETLSTIAQPNQAPQAAAPQ